MQQTHDILLPIMDHLNWHQFLRKALIAPQLIDSKLDLQASDYDDFVAFTINQGTASLLLERLEEHKAISLVPGAVIQALQESRRLAWVRESFSHQQLVDLIRLLDNNQIEHIILKGTALAYSLYSKSYHRPRLDTDIWIKPSSKQRLEILLQKHGFEKIITNSGVVISHQSSFFKKRHGFKLVYDIHWQISNRNAYKDRFDFDEMYQTKQRLARLNRCAYGLNPVNALLHSSVHFYGHYPEQRDHLIWIYDFHLLGGHLDEDQWSILCDSAIDKQLHPHVSQALLLAQKTFGTHYPSAYLEKLSQTPNNLNKIELSRIHANSWSRFDQVKSDWAALNWKQRLILLKEYVFPSYEYMHSHYDIKRKWRLPIYYLHRVISGVGKWLKS